MGTISNIKSLKGMGILADRDAGSASLDFRRYNLIYGFNGSGKSTLSRLFASLGAGSLDPKLPTEGTFEVTLDDGSVFGCPARPVGLEQRLLVFNSDYIDRNLQWAAKRANPVFYIGADQAEAATELAKVQEEIIQADAKKVAAAAAEKSAEKTFAVFKKERAKSVASHLHLGNRKYEAPALAKDYESWKQGDQFTLTDSDLKLAEETCRLEEPMPRLELLSFEKATIETAYRYIVDVCSQSLATVALEEVRLHPDSLLWIKRGHEFHEAHGLSDCLFCGNPISVERRALLAAALDDKVDQFVARLNLAAEQLRSLVDESLKLGNELPDIDDLAIDLRARFRDVRENVLSEVRLLAKQLGTLQNALTSKIERPASPADLASVVVEDQIKACVERIAESIGTINDLIAAHNLSATDFAALKEKAEISIRRHFVVDCREEYAKISQELDDATESLRVATAAADESHKKAEDLRQKVRTHGPAAGVINRLIAAYLGHRELTIHAIEDGYELQRHGTPITGVPSEGEKTAIAICYFLSSIEAESRKLKDVIVVVDDPVSSLDTKALNFACSLVRSRLEGAAQVFILTHNLQCMNEFKKAWKRRVRAQGETEPSATFHFIDVTIPEGQTRRRSTIIEMSKLLREYDSEYHYLFSHVLRFAENPETYDDHGYMMPNVIRRVLEVFLAFKCPGSGGLQSQLDRLCEDYAELNREGLAGLLRLTQVESHSDNLDDLLSFSTMTLEETRTAATELVTTIEKVDSKHLERLKRLCR